MPDKKIFNDTNRIPDKHGSGIFRREIWVDVKGKVTRYNLAYINSNVHSGGNGRVVCCEMRMAITIGVTLVR